MSSIHQFKVKEISGAHIDFAGFAGKKILVVNVASECGYTPQYQQLQELYETFHDKLVVVGFPSNDFGGQEPGADADIQAFCQRRYGIAFPLAAKTPVKGPAAHPVYRWLSHQSENGVADTEVKWNFHKYLLDEAGTLVMDLPSSVDPFDERILNWLSA